MRRLALAALVLVGLGCGDADGVVAARDAEPAAVDTQADGPTCYELAPAPGVSQPCIYAAQAAVDCASLRSVRIDGVPMDPGTYGIQCGSDGRSIIWLQPHGPEHCASWVVSACVE